MSYRDQGKARSPALEKLAEQTRRSEQAGEAPVQTTLLNEDQITKRLENACGVATDRAGCLSIIAVMLCLAASGALAKSASWRGPLTGADKSLIGLLVVGALASTIGAFVLTASAKKRRDAAVAAELAWADTHPFPVTGYRDWLVNDVSVMVVKLQKALEKGTFVDAVKAIDPAIQTEQLDDTSYQLVIPSRVVTGEHPFRYGSVPELRRVFDNIVLPLHGDVGVERVAMGGTITSR
jgi:hypothetical protein